MRAKLKTFIKDFIGVRRDRILAKAPARESERWAKYRAADDDYEKIKDTFRKGGVNFGKWRGPESDHRDNLLRHRATMSQHLKRSRNAVDMANDATRAARKKVAIAAGLTGGGAILGGAAYLTIRKNKQPQMGLQRDFSAKLRLRELAREAAATDAKKRKASREGKQVVANTEKAKVRELSERLVELARVQSVTGQILNITPVPRKVADPILRSLRRKLEKGGDKQAVRAAFLGPKGPRMRRAGGKASPPKQTDLWKPRLVDIDGKKSILHYRITRQESHLKPSNADLPAPPKMTSEDIMRSHITASTGRAISTSSLRSSAMRLVSEYGGKTPVEGVYATPLDELIKNQREKIKAAITNARYPAEREITQTHGDNLLKVRKHKAIVDPTQRPGDDVTYTRQR